MHWLASLPRWVLAGLFVLLLLVAVLGWRSVPAISGAALALLFFIFFALLMALVGRRENRGQHSPH